MHRPLAAALIVAAAAPAAAQSPAYAASACPDDERSGWDGDRTVGVCEERTYRLPAPGRGAALAVDGGRNGGVTVDGTDAADVTLRARVHARARTEAEARRLLAAVRVETGGNRVRATGPDGDDDADRDDRSAWWVSYEADVPRRTSLDLTASNGGLRVDGVAGRIRLDTRNGGLHLTDVGGDVRGETRNGGLHVVLGGRAWDAAGVPDGGLDVTTRNGGVDLRVPEGYSARLDAGTNNGGFSVDFPVTVQGRVGRELVTTLGSGGAPVRVRSNNGGVRIRRAG